MYLPWSKQNDLTAYSTIRLLKEVKCDLDHIVIADITTLKESATPSGLDGAKAMVRR